MKETAVVDSIDRRPLGMYVPPSILDDGNNESTTRAPTQLGGYVRIVDARGKSFPCGFSRPVGSFSVASDAVGNKRRRVEMEKKTADSECCIVNEVNACEDEGIDTNPTPTLLETVPSFQKKTITEDRIHPEEAIFLHMRGLLRIESHHDCDNEESKTNSNHRTTMSTQDLFCNMLPECKIPLAAYLAYAHLRSQGYILIRYTDQRMNLLRRMNSEQRRKNSARLEATMPKNTSLSYEEIPDETGELNQNIGERETNRDGTPDRPSHERLRTRPLRLLLSDDVATAPPPCVVSHGNDHFLHGDKPNIRLAYYAYNPNAHFKRSNPGLPDFGIAVMPFRDEPAFDTLNLLVSMAEGGGVNETKSGIPLRVVTVADGGAVIAFGVTNGDVPIVNQST